MPSNTDLSFSTKSESKTSIPEGNTNTNDQTKEDQSAEGQGMLASNSITTTIKRPYEEEPRESSPTNSFNNKKTRYVSSPGMPEIDGSGNPLRNIREPHPHDVLCGRGGGTNSHSGNARYRNIVTDNKPQYITCAKKDKINVSKSIVEKIRTQNPPGRFLSRDDENGLWHDIGDKKAIEKTAQALREGAPDIREVIVKQVKQPPQFAMTNMSNIYPQALHQQQQQRQQQQFQYHQMMQTMSGQHQPSQQMKNSGNVHVRSFPIQTNEATMQKQYQQQQHNAGNFSSTNMHHRQPHSLGLQSRQIQMQQYQQQGQYPAGSVQVSSPKSQTVQTLTSVYHPGQSLHQPQIFQQRRQKPQQGNNGITPQTQIRQQSMQRNMEYLHQSQQRQQQPLQVGSQGLMPHSDGSILQGETNVGNVDNGQSYQHKQDQNQNEQSRINKRTEPEVYHDLFQFRPPFTNPGGNSSRQNMMPPFSVGVNLDVDARAAAKTKIKSLAKSSDPRPDPINETCQNPVNQKDEKIDTKKGPSAEDSKPNGNTNSIPSSYQIVHDNTHNKHIGPPKEIEVIYNGLPYQYILQGSDIPETNIVRIPSLGNIPPSLNGNVILRHHSGASNAPTVMTQLVSTKSLTGGMDDNGFTRNPSGGPIPVTRLGSADTWSGMSDVAMTFLNTGTSIGSSSMFMPGHGQQPQTIYIEQPQPAIEQPQQIIQQPQQVVYHTAPSSEQPQHQYATMVICNPARGEYTQDNVYPQQNIR